MRLGSARRIDRAAVARLHIVRLDRVEDGGLDGSREFLVGGVIDVAVRFRTDQRFDAARVVLLAGVAVNAEEQRRVVFLRHFGTIAEADVHVRFASEHDLDLVIPDLRLLRQRLARQKGHAQGDVLLQEPARAHRVVRRRPGLLDLAAMTGVEDDRPFLRHEYASVRERRERCGSLPGGEYRQSLE